MRFAWWRRLQPVLTPRRIVQVGLLGALTFVVTYANPQTALERVLVAMLAALLVFTQTPVLFGRRPGSRLRSGPALPQPAAVGSDSPAGPRRPRLRSRFRQRWPRIAGRLPGFRPRRPNDLPERLPSFRGRESELSRLERQLRAQPTESGRGRGRRRTRRAKDAPVVVIHGMPGVGKSALAQELGHRVADRYPHGQLYANLGSGGAERSAGEVLKEFLLALGWPEPEIPADTRGRGKIYRSLTRHRRILVVLDAARDHSQVRELLPNGQQQAVIVTSRRDLGPELDAVTLPLSTPSTGEALELFWAVAGTDRGEAMVHSVAVVRRCGHLPRALRAAGAYVAAGQGRLRDVARQLWSDIDLLDYLSHGGVNLRAGFESEYQRLLPRERQALRLLSLVESPTFVPWVLCPLLLVELSEAENLVTRLGAAHLLEVVGPAGVSGTARYRFHPLVHRFTVATRADEDDPRALERARARAHAAYRGVVRTVLTRIGEEVRPASPQEAKQAAKWLPPEFILDRIAESPEWWVRTEHANLVRCAEQAKRRGEWDLYWQIARWLGGCLSPGVDPASVADTLQASLTDAGSHTRPVVALQVRLASAGLLAATDRHGEVEQLLASTIELAGAERLATLVAVAHRQHAEWLLQIGAYEAAAAALRHAREAAESADPSTSDPGLDGTGERTLITLLEHICRGHQEPRRWLAEPPDQPLPAWHDSGRFRAQLARAEAAGRRGAWRTAEAELADALDTNRDDAGRVAAVEYGQARLYLARARGEPAGPARTGYALRAAERAAETLLTYRGLHNRCGELRARCLLTRALAAAGRVDEADWQGDKAHSALRAVAPAAGPAAELLHAAADQANGEVRLRRLDHPIPPQRATDHPTRQRGNPDQQVAEAIRLFRDAGAIFRRHGDWWAAADCDLGLGRAHRGSGHLSQAMAALWAAAASFEEAGDTGAHEAAVTELIATAEAMSHSGTVSDLRRALSTAR